jgi:transposase-like protein
MRRSWTPAEDATLRAHYAEGSARVAALTGRSVSSVLMRANRLDLHVRRHWTAAEDAVLVNHWGYRPIAEIAKMAGRTHQATYRRARELGIGSGSPQGFEYISAAAGRVGYDPHTLRNILTWAGVRVHDACTRENDTRRFPRHYVESLDVDDAVMKWLATETIASGAVRHGIAGCTLKKWLQAARAAGVKMSAEPGPKEQWRVLSSVIDAVVAERRTVAPVATVATRLGVSRHNLMLWLRAAGVVRPAGRYWMVTEAVAREVIANRSVVRGVAAEMVRRCA